MSVAIYPGSFDPLTRGHIDLMKRGSQIFDHLIIAVGVNTSKEPMFTVQERMDFIEDHVGHIENIEVDSFNNLVVEYAREKEAGVILRGIRTFSDFEYEFQMALTNRSIDDEIETVFIMPSNEYSFISSRLIKEIITFDGDVSQFVTEAVTKAMKEKMKGKE